MLLRKIYQKILELPFLRYSLWKWNTTEMRVWNVCERNSLALNLKLIPESTVGDIVRCFKNENRIASIPQTGRPKLLTEHDEWVIVRKIKRNPRLSVPKVRAEVFEEISKKVLSSTIRRTLKNNGYNGRIARRKPLINAMNCKRRLDFAKQYCDKLEHFWYDVIFADESKYNIFGSGSRREIVWRRPNKALKPINLLATVKHSTRVMVRGCITAAGVENLSSSERIWTASTIYVYYKTTPCPLQKSTVRIDVQILLE